MSSDLTCYRQGCRGTLDRCDDPDVLFRCDECGGELNRKGTEELADMDGPIAQLAETLLKRA